MLSTLFPNNPTHKIHSLLQTDLGVSLPLHVSLSRPLVLKTEQKDHFLRELRQSLTSSGVKAFPVRVRDLVWHANESGSRWFLVLRLKNGTEGNEMSRLLATCNAVAREFGQPVLYGEGNAEPAEQQSHISIAWCLESPASAGSGQQRHATVEVPKEVLDKLTAIDIAFREVKIRVGQDVHSIPLKQRRESGMNK